MAAPTALLVGLGLGLAGCLKSEQTFTIYPDGSGKMEISQTVTNPMIAQIMKGGNPMGGDDDGDGDMGGGGHREKPDPVARIRESMAGKVYWSKLEAKDGPNGEFVISGTGYFENVNDVQPQTGSISFKKTEDGGYAFEMDQDLGGPMKAGMGRLGGAMGGGGEGGMKPNAEQQQQAKQMMKMMLAGFDAKITVVMPGAVKSAEGMKPLEGRGAQWHMGEDDLMTMMDKKEPPADMKMKVVCDAPTGIDDEIAKFRKELAAAKAADAGPKGDAKPAPEGGDKAPEKKKDF
jgi:hypothetical protein